MPLSSDLTDEQFNELKARDIRIRALDHSLVVAQELRECKTLQLVLAAIEDDVAEAITTFADCNPHDFAVVGELQARVHRLIYLKKTITLISSAGEAAAEALQQEDAAQDF